MSDTGLLERAPWLEAHDEFEGLGAHELNPRYEHVDGDARSWDPALRTLLSGRWATSRRVPKLQSARTAMTSPRAVGAYRLDGIDGSHHQPDAGPVDLQVVKSIPTNWAAWKATQSVAYLDPTFIKYRAAMKAAGFHCRGLYHWISSTTDIQQQAAWFISQVGALEAGEFVMLDAEEAGITEENCAIWCELMEAFFKRPCVAVYTGIYVSGSTIYKSQRIRNSALYGVRPIVTAAYVTPAVLISRKKAIGAQDLVDHAQQYSSDGPVAGITGRCDMDQVNDQASFDRIIAFNFLPPTTTITLEPTMHPFTNADPMMNPTDGKPDPATGKAYLAGQVAFVMHDDRTIDHLDGNVPADALVYFALGGTAVFDKAPRVTTALIAAAKPKPPAQPTHLTLTGSFSGTAS